MVSLLFPPSIYPDTDEERRKFVGELNNLSEVTVHDLGLDLVIKSLSNKDSEQNFILHTMSRICKDPEVSKYRGDIFEDIVNNKDMRKNLMTILEKIDFLRDYGSFKREYDESASVWDLVHRLEEINDYITCVEALSDCLKNGNIKSDGLLGLKDYVDKLYSDNAFEELKKDIKALKATTTDLKSVTVGINLNDRFEAESIGVVSINDRKFIKSNVIGNFLDKIVSSDNINKGNEWKKDFHYQPFNPVTGVSVDDIGRTGLAIAHPLLAIGMAQTPDKDQVQDIPKYMDRVTNHMLSLTTKKLKETLNKYVTITITDITNLIPEFIYYIRWAEYIEEKMLKGHSFCKSQPVLDTNDNHHMEASGAYNLKLLGLESDTIVTNDLDFDKDKCVYILTGANRGGKTTITQTIGQLFVMAQGGIYVAGNKFIFSPVDGIYTHFPADEDQTLDLGRLGEECIRFKEIFSKCTSSSLLLLNETFSTTSFEEGYYIAKDAVKAIINKGVRTIYNTHMHKLPLEIEELNSASEVYKAQSLVAVSGGGQRSFKIKVSAPEGKSYAHDIALKYGVTYDELINECTSN